MGVFSDHWEEQVWALKAELKKAQEEVKTIRSKTLQEVGDWVYHASNDVGYLDAVWARKMLQEKAKEEG